MRRLMVNLYQIADLSVLVAAFALAALFSAITTGLPAGVEYFLAARVKVSNVLLLGAFALGWHVILRSRSLYRSHRIGRRSTEWWEVTQAVSIGTLLLVTGATLLDVRMVDRDFVILFYLLALPGTLALRILLRALLEDVRRQGRNLRRVVVVGCGTRGERFGQVIRE